MRIVQPPATLISEITIDGNIDMGGFILTNLGAGSGDGESIRHQQLLVAQEIAYGTYSGNAGVDRAVAHGLSTTPTGYMIFDVSGNHAICHAIQSGQFRSWKSSQPWSTLEQVFRAADATNIYVGDAADQILSCNWNGMAYQYIVWG